MVVNHWQGTTVIGSCAWACIGDLHMLIIATHTMPPGVSISRPQFPPHSTNIGRAGGSTMASMAMAVADFCIQCYNV